MRKEKLDHNLTQITSGGPRGTLHMKGLGMLVVSLRDVNFGLLSHLRVFWAKRHHI